MKAVCIEISKLLDHEANRRQCPHGPVTASGGMTQMCARKGMVFSVVVPRRVQNVKNCTKLAEFSALRANNFTDKPLLGNNCATKPVKGYPFFVDLCQ